MNSIMEAVARNARERPTAVAVTDGREALSYEGLWRGTEEWAETLDALLDRTRTMGLCLDNSPGWVLLDLASIHMRVPMVPLPLFFNDAQRRHALSQSGASSLIADRPLPGFGDAKRITVSGRTVYMHQYDANAVVLPADTAKITYTSGTTGQAKGVCLSQAALERVANAVVDVIGEEYAGVHCAVLSLAILLENAGGLYPTLLAGGRYHVPPLAAVGFGSAFSPDFTALARALKDCDATSAIMVPEILRGLSTALEQNAMSLPAMKLLAVGGARISRQVLSNATDLGLPVFQGYGLSEAGSVVALNVPGRNRLGSVGQPLPGVELTLAPDGEILITRPAFLGYIGGDPAPIHLATGDIGRFDVDGYLFIEGRKSDSLITAFGRNIAPEWIESELLSQSAIGQALAFGDAMPALGALIVPSSSSVTDRELAVAVARANRSLPEYAEVRHWAKVPVFTVVNQQLTANGRLRREAIARDHRHLMTACFKQPGRYLSFFEELIAATASGRSRLLSIPQIRDGLAGRIALSTYVHYLAEAYHHVKHTVSLMHLANQGLPRDQVWLRTALDQYISEETGHEEWILEDIAQAGGDAQSVRNGTPRFATELMVAYAYDFVGRVNPVGFFGMVFVLESTSEQLASRGAHALMQTLKLPPNCFRYLLSHGAVDVDHMRFFQNLMFQIDDPRDQAAVIQMANAMYGLYGDVFRSIPHSLEHAYGT
jgi:long-chain acyl-CoA synthetase